MSTMIQEMRKLTDEQKAEVQSEMVANGVPVRFSISGHNLNICTGELLPRGINVMYMNVYWNFTKETAQKIGKWLAAQVIFSE